MLTTWIAALETLGYDIIRRDPLIAHKESGTHKSIDVEIDETGQLRAIIATGDSNTKSETRVSASGRAYKIFREQKKIVIVNYHFLPHENPDEILAEIENEN
ncbi:MAG: hypothetical protein HY070_06125 [Chloroflexi bacterium]|nr:hypothetical protein [Chloroflexota bacterium]